MKQTNEQFKINYNTVNNIIEAAENRRILELKKISKHKKRKR